MNEQLSRVQENGRFVTGYLGREIKGAGYLGCLQDVDAFESTLNNATNFVYNYRQAIYGLEATGTDIWKDENGVVDPTTTGTNGMDLGSSLSGSDILVLRTVNSDVESAITVAMPLVSADLTVTAGLGGTFATGGGDILLISDCQGASLFQTTSYTNSNGNMVHNTGGSITPGNVTQSFMRLYTQGSQIFFPRTITFYVRNNNDGIPSLYRKIGLQPAEELVEGVENLQIRYGEDTSTPRNRAADIYVTANNVTDWANIVSVRIGLLLRSPGNLHGGEIDTRTYDVNGTDIDAPGDDRRLRMVMGKTSGIRNRLR
jgi:type IV pilus assembly protein PilW